MIISWDWIKEYVEISLSPEELAQRLAMAGLNHESTISVGNDLAIDLEVTSNRPDWLGHLGIAREIAVLTDKSLCVPDPQPRAGATLAADLVRIVLESPHFCPRYTARIIRGVKIGNSPTAISRRLKSLGIPSINNVVDATNYVMFECGQPLHAFDFGKLAGDYPRRITVREARAGEAFTAIDHREYRLEPGMCMIADDRRHRDWRGDGRRRNRSHAADDGSARSVGPMFAPLAVRSTARTLNLHSPSSYRFERGVDWAGIDWASRRCCEIILNCAGGELADGVVDVVHSSPTKPSPIHLSLPEVSRILGIEIDSSRVRSILIALGLVERTASGTTGVLTFEPPSWRPDLTREVDLIEEVARIHGYDQIPEDVAVPMVASQQQKADRVVHKVRQLLIAAGFHEAITASVVPQTWNTAISPWSMSEPFRTSTPLMRGADSLRRSLLPSLLSARADNEKAFNNQIELFETARIYLPQHGGLPHEPWMVAVVSERSYTEVKGILESLFNLVRPGLVFEARRTELPHLAELRTASMYVDGERCGVLGELSSEGCRHFELQRSATVAEIQLEKLISSAMLVTRHANLSSHPPVERDFNLILDETTLWSALHATVHRHAGPMLDDMLYRETYRDKDKDGKDKKRVLFSLRFRASDRTLTSAEVDACCQLILAACRQDLGAVLLA